MCSHETRCMCVCVCVCVCVRASVIWSLPCRMRVPVGDPRVHRTPATVNVVEAAHVVKNIRH